MGQTSKLDVLFLFFEKMEERIVFYNQNILYAGFYNGLDSSM